MVGQELPVACALADTGNLEALQSLPTKQLWIPDKYGSGPIHWAAGSGHLEVVRWLHSVVGMDAESEGLRISSRTKRRRPLHYAARNGRLEICRYLCEELHVDADPNDHQLVTPFQLAVWQNQAEVAAYLVESRGVDPLQRNTFGCAAQHWIGTCPPERTGPLPDGEGLLPLARWLTAKGVDWKAPQRQGHLP